MFSRFHIISSANEVTDFVKEGKRYFIYAAEEFDFESLKDEMREYWVGAVFPMIFYHSTLYVDKAFVCELSDDIHIDIICNDEFEDSCDECHTYMVFADGLDNHINSKLEKIFSNTPENAVMFGAGCGKTTMINKNIIYNGKRFTQNAIISLKSPKKCAIGVNHGYIAKKDFFVITEASETTIKCIDGQDAFSYYKNYIKKNFDLEVTQENLFFIGLKHPFMFACTYGEKIVRIPTTTDGKVLHMVGEINQDTIASIGTINDKDLVDAALKSIAIAKEGVIGKPSFCIVYSCLGREKYSHENFVKELEAISEACSNVDVIGALSIGEIANTSQFNLEFYNSTCVVGVM